MRSESNRYATFRSILLTSGAASALSLGLTPAAFAQDAAVEKVTVTGTRIKQKNLLTTSPVTQVTNADIKSAGVTRVEELTNSLPQVFAGEGKGQSINSSGSAEVNLRGLGSQRTLVLIDGRRMPYATPTSSAADLNQIPGPLVERIELLTGGASAVYGSDAIAGVVNFIMRRDFEGVQIDLQYGFYEHENNYSGPGNVRAALAARQASNPAEFRVPPDHWDGGWSKQATAVAGASTADGHGNVTAFVTYRSNDEILQRDFDYSACAVSVSGSSPNFGCGGSATNATGTFTNFATFDYTIDGIAGNATPDGQARNRTAADAYNYAPLSYYARPDERYTIGTFARYEIDEQVELYSDLMYNQYSSRAQYAPSGNFGNTSTINCGNPFLNGSANGLTGTSGNPFGSGAFSQAQLSSFGCTPAAIAANTVVPMYILRRNVEGGPRQEDYNLTSLRVVGGARGDIAPGWEYDLSMQYSRVSFSDQIRNVLHLGRLANALNVVATDPAGNGLYDDPLTLLVNEGADSVATCQSVVDGTDPNCVPWNIFQLGGVTQEALGYLDLTALVMAHMTQHVASASVSGDLETLGIKSPWASTAPAIVVGAEFRRDAITDYDFDDASAQGLVGGFSGAAVVATGAIDVNEYFGEIQIPLIEDAPFAKLVSVDFAYRSSDYDTGAHGDTWKFGAEWHPTEDFRFRYSFQKALRAPNIVELLTPNTVGLFGIVADPCDRTQLATYRGDAACIGVNPWQVTAAQADSGFLSSPAGQYNVLTGGNLNLSPELVDTFTAGIILTPTFVKNFTASVDYWQIELTNAISTIGSNTILNACYTAGVACNLISRNGAGNFWSGPGTVDGRVENTGTNVGGIKTSGVDVVFGWRVDLADLDLPDAGSVNLEGVGTWIDTLSTNPGIPGAVTYDCVGYMGSSCGTPNPEWRHRAKLTWDTPWDVSVGVTWRYIDEVTQVTSIQPVTFVPATRPDHHYAAQDYFDLAFSAGLPLNSRLRIGVNNVFDKDPPISQALDSTGDHNGNTYPNVYDANGRFVFLGLSVDM